MTVNHSLSIFLKDSRGYVAVVFGILLLPLLGIAGAAIDFRAIGREQIAIRAAAEAAAVAIARANFKPDTSGGTIPVEDVNVLAAAVFNTNYPNSEGKVENINMPIDVDGINKTATVTVTADAKTTLLQIIGYSSFPISVSARAAAVFSEKNVQVHFVFDMSPSIGAPDDGSPPPLKSELHGGDGCFFMCHDDGSTIRRQGLIPKMDTVINTLAGIVEGHPGGQGFVKTLGEAAE